MKRSAARLLLMLALGGLAGSLPVGAQPPVKVVRRGRLSARFAATEEPFLAGFLEGMRERGYEEG